MKNNILLIFDKFLLTFISNGDTVSLQSDITCIKSPVSLNPIHTWYATNHGKEGLTILMKDKLTLFTKYLLDFMFYSGIFVIITLPFSVRFYGRYSTYFAENYYSLCVVLFLSGIFAILIVQQLRRMFKTVIDDDCFIHENVKSLEKMSSYSFFIAVITACRLFIFITPSIFIIILVFVIAGLFSKVLAGVFDKAVTYKLENDLTI